jgi:type III pantothenate kinase
MSIVIDIGNTSTKIYKVVDGKVLQSGVYETDFAKWMKEKSASHDLIIASVVPEKTAEITKAVKKLTGIEPFVIKHAHYKDLKSRYLDIKELGIDRLCNIAYAVKFYKKNVVVIDFGSAVTLEIINGKGEFEGGMIFPGIKLQYESLAKNTALLPDLKAEVTDFFIGRSTAECIRSGVQNGIAGICNDFIREFAERLSSRVQIILSGGDAELLGKLVDFDFKLELHTVPIGAWIIRQMNKEK